MNEIYIKKKYAQDKNKIIVTTTTKRLTPKRLGQLQPLHHGRAGGRLWRL